MANAQPSSQLEYPQVEQVTLNEFCIQLSQQDRRVELIGAFNHAETEASRIKDTAAQYRARFDAFTSQPV